jgi:hypothetical protein
MAREFAVVAQRASWVALLCVAAWMLAPSAGACPSCAEGLRAREAVAQNDFGRNLATAALPFLIIGAVCARVHRIRSYAKP